MTHVRREMLEEDYQCLVVCSLEDLRYLSNYRLTKPQSIGKANLVISSSHVILFTDADDLRRAKDLSVVTDVRATSNIANEVSSILRQRRRGSRLGVVGWNFLPVPVYLLLKRNLPGVTICDASSITEGLRMKKSEAEVRLLCEAARIADAGQRAAARQVRKRKSEIAIAIAAEVAMEKMGSEGIVFSSFVGSGDRTNLIDPPPSSRTPQRGDFVLIDISCRYEGYCGDTSRTKSFGKLSNLKRRVFDAVIEMHAEAIKAIRPGVRAFEIHEIARETADKYGYGNDVLQLTGHGIGLSTFEKPVLETDRTRLEVGMVFAVEPALYVQKVGGVRIEDMLLVTEYGCKLLTSFDRGV